MRFAHLHQVSATCFQCFRDELDTTDNLLAHLDTRAYWDQHKQERIASLFAIADRCLEARRKKRSELVDHLWSSSLS
jgi:hypothetical protein